MDIKQLRSFLAVANARSFLGAADTLFISRQAVSKTISQLEDELGIELFVRDQSGAMMTPAGIYFYPRASALVADFDKLQQEMREIDRAYRPTLSIYMALGIHSIFARALQDYAALHQREMDIQLGGCLDADCETTLTDRRADAVLSYTPISGRMAESTVLLETPLRLLVNREGELARESALGPGQLSATPLLLYTGGGNAPLWWPDRPGDKDISSSDLGYLLDLLRMGLGILPMPRVMLQPSLEYTVVMPCSRPLPPCHLYYSTLASSYYDSLTFNLLSAVKKDVFNLVKGR